MKKTYQKPELYAESFLLQEHIAACSAYAQDVTYASHNNGSECYFRTNSDWGTIQLFLNGTDGCEYNMEDIPGAVPLDCYGVFDAGTGEAFSSM